MEVSVLYSPILRFALFFLALITSFGFNYFAFVKPPKSEMAKALLVTSLLFAAVYISSYLGTIVLYQETHRLTLVKDKVSVQVVLESMRYAMIPYIMASVICMMPIFAKEKEHS